MDFNGVVYDVGLRYSNSNELSIEPFDPELVAYDMRALANDMHANAVRIEGEPIDRLVTASQLAHEAGLTVFFSPWKMDAGFEENQAYLAEAAAAAEQLRVAGVDIIFIEACEYTIFNDGIYPGSTIFERAGWAYDLLDGDGWPYLPVGLPEPFPAKAKELNETLAALAETVRATFKGPVTYSAAIFEDVDWSIFDYVGTNYYREKQTEGEYQAGLDYFASFGKPILVMEIGCCAYEGAARRGSRGWRIMSGADEGGNGQFENGIVPTRSETEQADYLEHNLGIFESHPGVGGAFIFCFYQQDYPTGEGAKDLDMAAFGIAKTFPADHPRSSMIPNWEPKEAFFRAGDFFQKHAPAAKTR